MSDQQIRAGEGKGFEGQKLSVSVSWGVGLALWGAAVVRYIEYSVPHMNVVYLDFRAACGMVFHGILIYKLRKCRHDESSVR